MNNAERMVTTSKACRSRKEPGYLPHLFEMQDDTGREERRKKTEEERREDQCLAADQMEITKVKACNKKK